MNAVRRISCLLILALSGVATADDTLEITFDTDKIALDEDARFECEDTSSDDVTTQVFWTNPDGERVSELNGTRLTDIEGELVIEHVTFNDSGVYTCFSSDAQRNATVTLTVYEMPDYTLVMAVLFVINAVLVVAFGVCLIRSSVRQRRRKRKYEALTRAAKEVPLASPTTPVVTT